MHHVFYLKFAVANISLIATLVVIFARWPVLERRPHEAIFLYYIARIVLLAAALLKFHFGYPAENMGMYYYDAELVLKGAVPNRDFFTLYGILYPYWLAGSVWLWHNRFAIVLLLQLAEFAAVYSLFTQRKFPLTLRSFLVFAFNPVVLVWIWIGLSNQVMCLGAAAAALALRSEWGRSLIFALTFASSKIFSLWTILPALLCQRVRTWFIFGAAVAVIYIPFLLVGSTGISMKATEADGYITDNTNHTGVLSLVGLIQTPGGEVVLTRPILMVTGALLLATLVTALWMRFRLKLGATKDGGNATRDIIFIGAFTSLLTMIYQAFATYTIPDYILGVIILGPVLARVKFWTAWDEALIAVTCYFLAVVYLLWFHFAEFGNDQPRTSVVYDVPLVICNLCVFALLARCAWRTFNWYAPQLRGHQRA